MIGSGCLACGGGVATGSRSTIAGAGSHGSGKECDPPRTRTENLLIKSQLLCQIELAGRGRRRWRQCRVRRSGLILFGLRGPGQLGRRRILSWDGRSPVDRNAGVPARYERAATCPGGEGLSGGPISFHSGPFCWPLGPVCSRRRGLGPCSLMKTFAQVSTLASRPHPTRGDSRWSQSQKVPSPRRGLTGVGKCCFVATSHS